MSKEEDIEISTYFRANFSELQSAISPQDMKKFVSLESDAERIGFLLSYPETHALPIGWMSQMQKSREKALAFKDAGNKLFSSGVFFGALEKYSDAVLLAPREELGIILANRSATLYHLEQYNHALTDANEALRIGYPQNLFYKIEERRARCLLALKRNDKAVQAFRNALKALDDAKLPLERKQKIEADIRVMLAVIDKGNKLAEKIPKAVQKKEGTERTRKPIPKIPERNPLYPSCSSAVEIRDDGGEIGRHAVATKNIEPGEILAIEKPHCASLLAEYRLSHCHYCFDKVFVPVPSDCLTCTSVAYCSLVCRDADAEIHKYECPILPNLWISKTSVNCFLALRAITQRPFEELFKLKDKLTASKGKFEVTAELPYRPENYQTFYGLVTHQEERTAEELVHRAYIATWLLRLLKLGPYFPKEISTPDTAEAEPSEGELFIGGLILHNLMALQFNSHEISELEIPKAQKTLANSKNKFIGGGLYPTVALFNHSCNPGVIRYFHGTTMIVRAIRSIAAGEEISENYGPIFTTIPEAERKRKLRWQYWFDCKCEACVAHWPVLEDVDPTVLRYKCETGKKCGNVLLLTTNTNEFMIKCPKCGTNNNIFKGLKALQDTDAIFKTASRNLEEGNHEKALKSYLQILKLLDETLALPMSDYHLCQEGARLCMLPLGNTAYV